MPSINRIPGNLNVEEKRNTRKLSFTKGEVFSGAVVGNDEDENGNVTIKIGNQWQISAKVEGNKNLQQGLARFRVIGFENGMLRLEAIEDEAGDSKGEDNSLDELIKNLGLSKDDKELLGNMLKYNMPLTKSNIAKVKGLMDFINNLNSSKESAADLARRITDSKNIDQSSQKGIEMRNKLQNLFEAIKGLSKEELMVLLENNIDLTSENIDSLKKLISEDNTIYKDINLVYQEGKNLKDDNKISYKEIEISTQNKSANINQEIKSHNAIKDKVVTENVNLSEKGIETKGLISLKLTDMKEMLKGLLNKETPPSEFISTFKNVFNDFKVFNSLSENYYMVNVPININNEDYGCNLIIKDDRKSGKKIDSKNVKIVASVSTVNMGKVDAYITLRDKNMKVDIKAEGSWTGALRRNISKINEALKGLGYNPFVNVVEKKEDADIITTREFFNEAIPHSLNVKV